MAKKPKVWKTTCKRYVAFMDIMGFRDKVFRESHDDIKKMFTNLRPAFKSLEKETKRLMYEKKSEIINKNIHPTLFPVKFSDSIILFSSDDTSFSASYTLLNTLLIMYQAIRDGIPIKGALAFGEVTAEINESLYFGKPIIDAYELQNELKLYGVILHHTFEKRLKEMGKEFILSSELLKEYPVPMKSGIINHRLIDWTIVTEKSITHTKLVANLYNYVSGKPRIYVDNTLEFVREVLKRKRKKKPLK